MSDTDTDTAGRGGFAGDPADALTVTTAAPTAATAGDPCCGTKAEAAAEGSCCGSAAKSAAVAAGQGCCG